MPFLVKLSVILKFFVLMPETYLFKVVLHRFLCGFTSFFHVVSLRFLCGFTSFFYVVLHRFLCGFTTKLRGKTT